MQKGIDHIGVGCGVVILGADGKIFAALRGKGVRNESGKWEFPGGAMEFGETIEACIKREALEEFGLTIKLTKQLGIYDHILPKEKQHWISVQWLARLIKGRGQINEPEKADKIGWFTGNELKTMPLTNATSKQLLAYLKGI